MNRITNKEDKQFVVILNLLVTAETEEDAIIRFREKAKMVENALFEVKEWND